MASYTVPTTGTYRTTDGLASQFYSGAVIDLLTAIRFQMPGAALPAEVDLSAAALKAAIDANATADTTPTDVQALIDTALALGDYQTAAESDARIAAVIDALHPDWTPGLWYETCVSYGGLTNAQGAMYGALYLHASPIVVPKSVPIDRIGFNVSVAAAAGKLARLMVFGSLANGMPGALLVDGGTVLVDATGDRTVTVATTLPTGIVYAAFVSDGSFTMQTSNPYGGLNPYGYATPTPPATSRATLVKLLANTNAPATFGTPDGPASVWYRIGVRAA